MLARRCPLRPDALDLRDRVAAAVAPQEGVPGPIARRYRVSPSFITRLLRLRRRSGSLTPRPHGGGHPPTRDHAGQKRLRQWVRKRPDATPQALAGRVGVRGRRRAICPTLRQRKISRQKQSLPAQERDARRVRRKRRAVRAAVTTVDPEPLVFLDETGANPAMTRTGGRAPRGPQVPGAVPGPGKALTLISGWRLTGMVASLAFPGAPDTPAFESDVAQALAPHLRTGDGVIGDNLKPPQAAGTRRAVAGAGTLLMPLPPYRPDRTPIAERFATVKGGLPSAAAGTTAAVDEAMGAALRAVGPEDILGGFKSCGLCATQG